MDISFFMLFHVYAVQTSKRIMFVVEPIHWLMFLGLDLNVKQTNSTKWGEKHEILSEKRTHEKRNMKYHVNRNKVKKISMEFHHILDIAFAVCSHLLYFLVSHPPPPPASTSMCAPTFIMTAKKSTHKV